MGQQTHVNLSKAAKNSLIAVVMKYAWRDKAALLPVLTDSEGTTAQCFVREWNFFQTKYLKRLCVNLSTGWLSE